MTRQRKEIQKQMEELDRCEQCDMEMGCGFGISEIADAFAPHWNELREKMAATYGKTAEEYEMMCYEIQNRLYSAGVAAFN